MYSGEKIVQEGSDSSFRTYFDEACRLNGIYAPHSMDGVKLRQKWDVFKEKCPGNYKVLTSRYIASDASWAHIMALYFRG